MLHCCGYCSDVCGCTQEDEVNLCSDCLEPCPYKGVHLFDIKERQVKKYGGTCSRCFDKMTDEIR